jgi:hypothetical protein
LSGIGYEFQVFQGADQGPFAVAIGDVVSGFLPPVEGVTATYTFDGAAGQQVFFDVIEDAGSVYWELFDPVGDLIDTSGFHAQPTWVFREGGTYTLTLIVTGGGEGTPPYTQPYQFQLVDVPPTPVVPLTLNEPFSGTLSTLSQVDRYSFDGTAG